MSWQELLKYKPPTWLIEGVLPSDAISMIYGYSGSGKSFWALDMALCVATGRDWDGHAVQQGEVVYIMGEGAHGYGARLQAWVDKHRCNPGRFTPYKYAVHLWHSQDSIRQFVRDITGRGINPSLIVIDTLSTALGGANENDNGQMREILDAIDDLRTRWGAAVLLVHHTGAVNERIETVRPSLHAQSRKRARGAQALQDGVAMHARLIGDGETSARLTCTKQRDDAQFAPIERTLYRMDLGDGRTSLAFADAYATGPRDTTRRRIKWDDIEAVLEAATAPMTPKEIADALGLGPSGRKTVSNHLASHSTEVYQPAGSSGYILTRKRLTTPVIMPGAAQLVA